jgi:hypothetical protein
MLVTSCLVDVSIWLRLDWAVVLRRCFQQVTEVAAGGEVAWFGSALEKSPSGWPTDND